MSRFAYVMLTYFCVMAVAVGAFIPKPLRLIWNASASVPIGLYEVHAPRDLAVGDLVAIRPAKPLADYMVARGYIGPGVPLMKSIAALPGQLVCRKGRGVSVDGLQLGEALERDRHGRPLPVWQGCRRLAPGQIFVMNRHVRDSLDGRYFGPIPTRAVIGKATPLYTDVAGDGRFVWCAPMR